MYGSNPIPINWIVNGNNVRYLMKVLSQQSFLFFMTIILKLEIHQRKILLNIGFSSLSKSNHLLGIQRDLWMITNLLKVQL